MGQLHRKKRFTNFPSPAGMSLTKLPLGRNYSVLTSLFPQRESLVVTSRLGTGKSRTLFYGLYSNHLYVLQSSMLQRPSGSVLLDDSGIEPWNPRLHVTTFALVVGRSEQYSRLNLKPTLARLSL